MVNIKPDQLTIEALLHAIKRCVKIRIITSGQYIDTKLVRKASEASWSELLKAKIEIKEDLNSRSR